MALFDERYSFDRLRVAFFDNNLEESLELLRNVIEENALDDVRLIYRDLKDAFKPIAQDPEPVDFARRAWPAYIDTILSNSNYYFSPEELVYLCSRARRPIVVFSHDPQSQELRCVSGQFSGEDDFIMVGLLAVPGRTRTHFERLIPEDDALDLEENVGAEKGNRSELPQARDNAKCEASGHASSSGSNDFDSGSAQASANVSSAAGSGSGIVTACDGPRNRLASLKVSVGNAMSAIFAEPVWPFSSGNADCGETCGSGNDSGTIPTRTAAESGEDQARAEEKMKRAVTHMSLFGMSCKEDRPRQFEMETLYEAAQLVSENLLNSHVTVPSRMKSQELLSSGARLPLACCAVRDCAWEYSGDGILPEEQWHDVDAPWDRALRIHVQQTHNEQIRAYLPNDSTMYSMNALVWDVYLEALSIKERSSIPLVGPSIDRRSFEQSMRVFNDERIGSLICLCCARIRLKTGGPRSDIKFVKGSWLLSRPVGSLSKNLSMATFTERYRQPETPLSANFMDEGGAHDIPRPNFEDWQLRLHHSVMDAAEIAQKFDNTSANRKRYEELAHLAESSLLCCPEDLRCQHGCVADKTLCRDCEVPVCFECEHALNENVIGIQVLCNDNWYGYVHKFICEMEVTWMEKTVASPFWTGMTLFSVEARKGTSGVCRKHMMHETLFSSKHRVAFKGQMFSAPMDWASLCEQLDEREPKNVAPVLPVTGELLAAQVRVSISSGLVDLNKLMKQATVRRPVCVQLIRLLRDTGHPDYQVDMEQVETKSHELADTDDAVIPKGLVDVLDSDGEDNPPLGVDKAATPAERVWTRERLEAELHQARPQTLVAQRDSDSQKQVEASRIGAFGNFTELDLRTGSTLLDQIQTSYLPRVFPLTLPWCVGGPDFPRRGVARHRRTYEDAPPVSMDDFTAMTACRAEYQMRADWDLNPGILSLAFAFKVNLSSSLGIRNYMAKNEHGDIKDADIAKATQNIYNLLWNGEYLDGANRRLKVNGDVSKLPHIIGLQPTEKAMIRNYQFMSSRIAGTRQVRARIRHIVFSSRVSYGNPVFVTITPSERHSGLMIRLFRGRQNDPAFSTIAKELQPWIGRSVPSMKPSEGHEEAAIELPEYDIRRLISSRDPLAAVYTFNAICQVLIPTMFGFRMCPRCPQCSCSSTPCMDVFGSNATASGGFAGRADAAVGAKEHQSKEGVMHTHFFVFLQWASQHHTLHEIAEMLESRKLSIDAIKHFIRIHVSFRK